MISFVIGIVIGFVFSGTRNGAIATAIYSVLSGAIVVNYTFEPYGVIIIILATAFAGFGCARLFRWWRRPGSTT